ncbi:MAG: arylamine N-acetyltransferase [Bacillota bacterium]|nr:arylamine N-acetyltransferase [Bacillota bacterium]
MVKNNRGGYCFEMNGLFSIILKQLGFKVTDLLARVIRDGAELTAKTHQVLLVEIGDVKYLADVGFGNKGITAPIIFKENIEQMQFTQIYRIVNSKYGYSLQCKDDIDYLSLYTFTIEECLPVDYDMSNFYSYANPKSIFRSMKFITKPTLEGRLTMTGNQMKILHNGQETVTVLSSDKEYIECLHKYFGIDMERVN